MVFLTRKGNAGFFVRVFFVWFFGFFFLFVFFEKPTSQEFSKLDFEIYFR